MSEPATPMRAILRHRYGTTAELILGTAERPQLTPDGVLVRVCFVGLNRLDWYSLQGLPYVGRVQFGLRQPRSPLLGVDFAGVVEAVGADVSDFRVGDEVFGGRSGALAEWVNVRVALARKPEAVSLEQAAAVPVAGITALQALRDKGRLEEGQRVLINGASGGVGTVAIQVARALGGEVTAVCSTAHVATARELGADHVIDYTVDDFTQASTRYDVLLDVAGARSWRELRRVLNPHATVVVIGGPASNRWFGPMTPSVGLWLAGLLSRRRVRMMTAKFNRADVQVLAELMHSGALTPKVTARYPIAETAAALDHLGEGHVDGKIVVAVAPG